MNQEFNYNSINLFRNTNDGILSTLSKKIKNYPFGSFVTFITGRDRSIFLYLSDIAEHTKNLKNNSKACLTISKKINYGDKQNSQRLTILGDLIEVNENKISFCKERFHKFFVESKKYSEFHSFKFYQLTPINARWIGGFGKICWLDHLQWSKSEDNIYWKDNEDNIIKHMNEDHQNSIVSSLIAQHNITDTKGSKSEDNIY